MFDDDIRRMIFTFVTDRYGDRAKWSGLRPKHSGLSRNPHIHELSIDGKPVLNLFVHNGTVSLFSYVGAIDDFDFDADLCDPGSFDRVFVWISKKCHQFDRIQIMGLTGQIAIVMIIVFGLIWSYFSMK